MKKEIRMKKDTESKVNKVDPKLLEVLVCPLTKTNLIYDQKNNELISQKAGLAFPIRKGIPIMLEEKARKIEKDKF